jgi:hypothetical protein
MTKKLFLLFLIPLLLTGCNQNIGNVNTDEVVLKHIKVAGENVFIGSTDLGAGETAFKPEITLQKWGTETAIKVWSEETGDATATQVGDKVVWFNTDKSKEYNFYPVQIDKDTEGYEYEIILKEKPKSNVINLKIDLTGINCYYQPELTQQEKDEGNFRPENVIGSYACYHSTKSGDYTALGGKNYMAGKAFHIYRPQMIDSVGNKTWGELKIEGNNLSVTIPQDFLDKAFYPINKASGLLFGYNTAGGTSKTDTATNGAYGSKFTSAAGTNVVNSISVYINCWAEAINPFICLSSTSNIITGGVAGENNFSVDPDWATVNYASPPSISASTDYLLMVAVGYSTVDIWYDTGSSNQGYDDSTNNHTTPQNLGTGVTNNTNKYSIYATYTASGATEDEALKYIKQPLIFD